MFYGVDDFCAVSTDADELFAALAVAARFLHDELGLRLNPKTTVLRLRGGVDYVGYRVHVDHVRPRRRNLRRARRRFRAIARRWTSAPAQRVELRRHVAAFAGMLTPCTARTSFNALRTDFRRWAGLEP